jgi:BASS family bile acid:Na+ symporter
MYAGLTDLMGNKLIFHVEQRRGKVAGESYSFVRLVERPAQLLFDRIFKVSIVLMLFFVMVGMGLTLTVADFKRVFQKPRGMMTGAVLQWGLMPLIAVALGRLMGFYEAYPFIFVGLVLITVSPGGVTSNLMTYYAKGDLALSISLTSFSTVLSLVMTPFLLVLYCANVPEVIIPVKLVVQTIIILVLIPLAVGMTVQARWPAFAKKATRFFAILGIVALLFLIIAGILNNLEVFAETERYGFAFYTMVFLITLLGVITGAVFPKLLRISNYQIRAISLETGLRNASLAMAIALLIQDYIGDFYSSMFITSAMFGLLMYLAGFLSIWVFKRTLPVEGDSEYQKFKMQAEEA